MPPTTFSLACSCTGVPRLLYQAHVLMLVSGVVEIPLGFVIGSYAPQGGAGPASGSWVPNFGKNEKRNWPLVCTGPSKKPRLVNQMAPPLGVVWTCVNSAYWAKFCRWTRML